MLPRVIFKTSLCCIIRCKIAYMVPKHVSKVSVRLDFVHLVDEAAALKRECREEGSRMVAIFPQLEVSGLPNSVNTALQSW